MSLTFYYFAYFMANNLRQITLETNTNSPLQLEKEIRKMEAMQPTDQLYTEHVFKTRDEIGKLENQLNVVQTRYGSVMSENGHLRTTIDHLLLER